MDVVYVPELERNLFSLNHALDQGFKMEASNEYCKLMSKDDEKTLIVGIRKGPLTIMEIKVRPTANNISANIAQQKATLKMWHERLAHQNLAHVRKFLKQNEINFDDENFECEPCLLGKQHRETFQKRRQVWRDHTCRCMRTDARSISWRLKVFRFI